MKISRVNLFLGMISYVISAGWVGFVSYISLLEGFSSLYLHILGYAGYERMKGPID